MKLVVGFSRSIYLYFLYFIIFHQFFKKKKKFLQLERWSAYAYRRNDVITILDFKELCCDYVNKTEPLIHENSLTRDHAHVVVFSFTLLGGQALKSTIGCFSTIWNFNITLFKVLIWNNKIKLSRLKFILNLNRKPFLTFFFFFNNYNHGIRNAR